MGTFLYETHLHTSQASLCGRSEGHEYIQRYLDAGYAGIVITDHFFRGNTCVNRSLPWPEFVNRYCAGYEDARNEGEKLGFPVFFGWEETFDDGNDFLVYGLDKAWLLEHPEVREWDRVRQFEEVRRSGGCVVQAHPFRAARYIGTIRLAPALVDAVEGYNSGDRPEWKVLDRRYAALSGLPVTAGSDIHHADRVDPSYTAGVVFDRPWDSIRDYVQAIRQHLPFGLRCPQPVPDWTEDDLPERPVVWMGRDGLPVQIDTIKALRDGFRDRF